MMKLTYFAVSSAALIAVTSAIALPQQATSTSTSTTTGPAPYVPDRLVRRQEAMSTTSGTTTATPTATPSASASGVGPAGAKMTHKVRIGPIGSTYFDPQALVADVGDMVVFEFRSGNHSLTESTYAAPCKPMTNGFDSNFHPNTEKKDPGPKANITVKDTKPRWFYCKQDGHCGKGMVFALNPPLDQPFADFRANALEQGTTAGDAKPAAGMGPSSTTSMSSAAATTTQTTSAASSTPTSATTTTATTGEAALVTSTTTTASSTPTPPSKAGSN